MIQFFIPGVPIPQARSRTFWHKGLNRYCTMNPKDSDVWRSIVKARAYPFRPKEPIDFPVRVNMEFYVPRPANAKGREWAFVRPDLDNYIKGTLDALQGAHFFKDDSRVVWLEAKKLYSKDGRVGVRITVLAVEENLNG